LSDAIFYRSALARPLTPEVQKLFESLLSRAEQIEALAHALPDQILANRSRREARPIKLNKSAQRTIRSFEQDSREAAATIPGLVAGMPSETLLVRSALGTEKDALDMDCVIYLGTHPEDGMLAKPLLELRKASIAELEAFVAAGRSLGLTDRDSPSMTGAVGSPDGP
jgi:hypothetical protein